MAEEQCEEGHGLEKKDWDRLIERIRSQRCIPFIGPGLCKHYYRPKAQIAEKWADSERYPFDDKRDLARVSQFLTLRDEDEFSSKERLMREFKDTNKPPSFKDKYEPHRVLAHLPFPVYITTNYDNYMMQALKDKSRDPIREYCDWRSEPKGAPASRVLTPANPSVFHLYGHTDNRESLILTETDYMRFLLNIAKFPNLIPLAIQESISDKSLLFLGYQVDEWDFRILMTVLESFFERGLRKIKHVAAQLTPSNENTTAEQRQDAQEHFSRYLKTYNVSVYWGTVEGFSKELLDRYRIERGDE